MDKLAKKIQDTKYKIKDLYIRHAWQKEVCAKDSDILKTETEIEDANILLKQTLKESLIK